MVDESAQSPEACLPPGLARSCATAGARLSRPQFAALVVITVASLGLRLWGLDRESLWIDELATVETYDQRLPQLVALSAELNQPPLDNLIGAVLDRLGLAASDWWVRLPAAIFGAGGVLLLGCLASRIAGGFAGIVAAAFLAVCPLHVAMSQEARPYAICLFFALASVLAFGRAWRRHTFSAWLVSAATLLSLLMTRWTDPHFIALGLFAFAVLQTLASHRSPTQADAGRSARHRLLACAAVFGVVYAAYGPIFGIILDRARRGVGGPGEAVLARAGDLLAEAYQAALWGYSWRRVFHAVPGEEWLLVVAGGFAILGLIAVARRSLRLGKNHAALLFAATFLPFPFLYAAVYALMGNATPKPQYLLIGVVPLFVLAAAGVDALRRRLAFIGSAANMAGAALLVSLMALPMLRATIDGVERLDKRDWRGVMGLLRERASTGDAFATIASDTVPPSYYSHAHGRKHYGLGDARFLEVGLRTKVEKLSESPWTSMDNAVWVVGYRDRMYVGADQLPPPRLVAASTQVHAFNGLFVLEVRGSGEAARRLVDAIETISRSTPLGRSLTGPAIVRGRYLLTHGDELSARHAFATAVEQCANEGEREIFIRDYLDPLRVAGVGPALP